MAWKRLFGWILKGLLALVLLLLGSSAIVMLSGVTLRLDGLKGPLTAAAGRAAGRSVDIDGRIRLIPTLWPTLELEQVRIGKTEEAGAAKPDRRATGNDRVPDKPPVPLRQ